MKAHVKLLFASILISTGALAQGPYAPAAGQPGSTAIHRDSSVVQAWASQCTVERGYMDIADPGLGYASLGTDSDGIGYADGAVVSLGDSGIAVLQFPFPIYDGPGPDLAVFENSFSDSFLELAKVFVSSDGVNYVEFPCHSLIPDTAEIGGFGSSDPTYLNNLAGKYRAQYGVPFDLAELSDSTDVNIMNITHVMLIDAVGTIDPNYATVDTAGNKIIDPYPTPFNSSGFDLDGIAFLHAPITALDEKDMPEITVYPNPVHDHLFISGDLKYSEMSSVKIYSSTGHLMRSLEPESVSSGLDLSNIDSGVYSLVIETKTDVFTRSFVKQ